MAFRLPGKRLMPASEMAVTQTQRKSPQTEPASRKLAGIENRPQAASSRQVSWARISGL